jgi:hypothetical protein
MGPRAVSNVGWNAAMKKRTVITSVLILATFNVRTDISDLIWMTGCWTLTGISCDSSDVTDQD